ncbi:MAG: hypothetical protein H0V36_08460 [Chloroflexi bacterium]|nr:hypothetical protein [Chloroflexota bacterium]
MAHEPRPENVCALCHRDFHRDALAERWQGCQWLDLLTFELLAGVH